MIGTKKTALQQPIPLQLAGPATPSPAGSEEKPPVVPAPLLPAGQAQPVDTMTCRNTAQDPGPCGGAKGGAACEC